MQKIHEPLLVIYRISFPNCEGSRKYIGKTTKGLTHKSTTHILNALNERKKCPYLENAIRLYGVENTLAEVLIECDYEWELSDLERAVIIEENSLAPNGYNITPGGDGQGVKRTDEYKKKKSVSMRKNHPNDGMDPWVRWTQTKLGHEGYIFIRPGFKSAQFCDPDVTMEENLDALMNVHALLNVVKLST